MKNKFFFLICLIFFSFQNLKADKYTFEVSDISVNEKGNLINANNGKITSKEKDLEITAEKFKYFKDLDILRAVNGFAFIKNENLTIKFQNLIINNKNILTANEGITIQDQKNALSVKSEKIILDRNNNILTASDGVIIQDQKNSLSVKSEKIILDRNKKIVSSNSKSLLKDKNKNVITSKKFEYQFENGIININDAIIKDAFNNNIKIKSALIDTELNLLEGNEIYINLSNDNLNPENEPRLSGKAVNYKENMTVINNGVFTTCKKTDKCPPWELSADRITHDNNKKSIKYDNVWLKIYDVPVVYFPKFFHPDPSVKRQSGFLIPTFKTSSNNNTYFSTPYFKVLDDNKDLTFTPRFYASDRLLMQSEYRVLEKNRKTITDLSFYTNKDSSFEGHFFYKSDIDLTFPNFSNTSLNLIFENSTDDLYLKANNLTSPLIKQNDLLEKSIKLNASSNDLNIETSVIVYENLNKKSNDKYEYILPNVNLTKKLKNKTNLNGDFEFTSDNFIHNYETNIFERVNNNSLIFSSKPKISSNGFYNNYEFILKNSNTNSQKSKFHKEGEDLYISGLYQFNSSYPLLKKNKNNIKLLKPKIALKISPGHTKDISQNEYKLDVNNIFNLDRLSSTETLEGGISLTYGADYILTGEKNKNEILSMKIANNLRLKENKDLENNNQIGAKTSNFFGEIKYSPLSFFNARYNLSTTNNLTDINYQNLITEIKLNNFSTTLDYLRQEGEKNSYLLNKTSYKFNESNNLSFSTRENLKTDLTEFYNLIYQYKNDCLAASVEYQKDYYSDRDIRPKESIFFKLTVIPFGTTSTPNLKK